MEAAKKKTLAAAEKLDGRRVWLMRVTDSSYRLERKEGTLEFQGGAAWPHVLIARWDTGDATHYTLSQAKELSVVVAPRTGGRPRRGVGEKG